MAKLLGVCMAVLRLNRLIAIVVILGTFSYVVSPGVTWTLLPRSRICIVLRSPRRMAVNLNSGLLLWLTVCSSMLLLLGISCSGLSVSAVLLFWIRCIG